VSQSYFIVNTPYCYPQDTSKRPGTTSLLALKSVRDHAKELDIELPPLPPGAQRIRHQQGAHVMQHSVQPVNGIQPGWCTLDNFTTRVGQPLLLRIQLLLVWCCCWCCLPACMHASISLNDMQRPYSPVRLRVTHMQASQRCQAPLQVHSPAGPTSQQPRASSPGAAASPTQPQSSPPLQQQQALPAGARGRL
jgi:hypothetical protein